MEANISLCELFTLGGTSHALKQTMKLLTFSIFFPVCVLYYRLACWVNISADDMLKYFLYFPQKTGFDISCRLSLYEMSNPVFWEK